MKYVHEQNPRHWWRLIMLCSTNPAKLYQSIRRFQIARTHDVSKYCYVRCRAGRHELGGWVDPKGRTCTFYKRTLSEGLMKKDAVTLSLQKMLCYANPRLFGKSQLSWTVCRKQRLRCSPSQHWWYQSYLWNLSMTPQSQSVSCTNHRTRRSRDWSMLHCFIKPVEWFPSYRYTCRQGAIVMRPSCSKSFVDVHTLV